MKNNKSICVLILAAGMGKRLGAAKPKPLFELLGKSSLQYVLKATESFGLDTFIMVNEKSYNLFQSQVKNELLLLQKNEGYGTGFAVISALTAIESYEKVLILQGDDPLIKSEDIKNLLEADQNDGVIQTAEADFLKGVGRVKIEDDLVESIEEGGREGLVNVGRYLLLVKEIKSFVQSLRPVSGEHRITDLINLMIKGGKKIRWVRSKSDFYMNMNTPQDAYVIKKELRSRINNEHLEAGVFLDVDLVTIGMDVIIAPGATIEGACEILGTCRIEKGATILNSSIIDSIIGCDTRIEKSVVEGAIVGGSCRIGPFAQLRRETKLDDGVKVGNFVEIKASSIGRKTKIKHHAYIGDSFIGEGCNIGCGVITANYDGRKKHQTEIGSGCFIGSNSVLVAPLTISANSFVAASSTITQNIPADSFAIARSPQVTKIGRAKKYL